MPRGPLIALTWVAGACVALTVSFVAVRRVASGVAPKNVAALSGRAIHDQLTTPPTTRPARGRHPSPRALSTTTNPTRNSMPQPSTSTLPWSAPTTPSTANSVPPAHAPDTTVPLRSRTFESTTTAPPVSSGPATATTSLGGTIWTRCSGPDAIVFIAAIPKSGYESIAGTQTSTAVQERFTNGNHVSTIQAECSDGVVHAEVEEEAE